MTRLEQQTFINDLMESFTRSMDADFMAGRIPEHWTGKQLRMYVCEKVGRLTYWQMSAKDLHEYENDCLINNL